MLVLTKRSSRTTRRSRPSWSRRGRSTSPGRPPVAALTPNQVTTVSLAVALLAAGCFAVGRAADLHRRCGAAAALLRPRLCRRPARPADRDLLGPRRLAGCDVRPAQGVRRVRRARLGSVRTGDDVWLLAVVALALQTVRHALDSAYAVTPAAAQAKSEGVERRADGRTPPVALGPQGGHPADRRALAADLGSRGRGKPARRLHRADRRRWARRPRTWWWPRPAARSARPRRPGRGGERGPGPDVRRRSARHGGRAGRRPWPLAAPRWGWICHRCSGPPSTRRSSWPPGSVARASARSRTPTCWPSSGTITTRDTVPVTASRSPRSRSWPVSAGSRCARSSWSRLPLLGADAYTVGLGAMAVLLAVDGGGAGAGSAQATGAGGPGVRREEWEHVIGLVLAAGAGRRLRPYTDRLPKALVPVDGDRTVLDVILANFAAVDLRDVAVVVGYAADAVAERRVRPGAPVRRPARARAQRQGGGVEQRVLAVVRAGPADRRRAAVQR